ncbi:chaperonin GroS [Pilaira anomala]|nr:chaperonin GroS [Pilaira anomala]
MSVATKVKNIIPLLDRVLVQRIKPEQKTSTGIYIPEKAQETPNQGHVLAVGKGMQNKDGKHIPTQLQVGDKIILPSYGGTPVKIAHEEYLLFRDSEILAKVAE